MLPGVPVAHTFMEYRCSPRLIRSLGPRGSFSYDGRRSIEIHFREFPLLSLSSVRELHPEYHALLAATQLHLLSFSSLGALAISNANSLPLSTVSPDPTPSLKTLAFVDCVITEGFVTELAQFASDRKNTASVPLHRVVIVNSSNEQLPSIVFIERLSKHVAVVEVMEGRKLPEDLLRLERIW